MGGTSCWQEIPSARSILVGAGADAGAAVNTDPAAGASAPDGSANAVTAAAGAVPDGSAYAVTAAAAVACCMYPEGGGCPGVLPCPAECGSGIGDDDDGNEDDDDEAPGGGAAATSAMLASIARRNARSARARKALQVPEEPRWRD